jgi:hypothetical protein
MKKYRVTSIPQSLPQAKRGKTIKLRKNKVNKDKGFGKRRYTQGIFKGDNRRLLKTNQKNEELDNYTNYTPIDPETEVQMDLPQQDYTWNTGTEVYRPGYFDEMYEKEWTSDKFDPYFTFGNLEKDIETGERIDCPAGYTAYKGECLPTNEVRKLLQRQFDQEIQDEKEKRIKQQEEFEAEMKQMDEENAARREKWRLEEYDETFQKSKKRDKIDPQYIVPAQYLENQQTPVYNEDGSVKTDENGNPITQSALEGAKGSHYVQKNEDGTYSLYPKSMMYDRIVNKGFFNNEFEQYWELDPKQVKEQLGDVQELARQQYDATMLSKIYDRALEEGKDVNTVISELPTSLGYTDAMTTQFQPRLSEEIQTQYDQLAKALMEDYDAAEAAREKYDLEKDFDFGDVAGTSMVGDNKVWTIVNDVDGKFTRDWINKGKTKEEREKRAKEVKETREAYYKNDPSTLAAYQKAAERWEQQYKDFGERAIRINETVGYDRYADMDYNFLNQQINREKGNWANTLREEKEENRRQGVRGLTGYDEEYYDYMTDIAGAGEDKRKLIEDAYKSDKITETQRVQLLNNLKLHQEDPENVPFSFNLKDGQTLHEFTGVDQAVNDLYSGKAYRDYLWTLPQYQNMKDGQGLFDKGDMSWYNYLWDVVTNPGEAIGAAIDPTKEMWDPKYEGISYNQRKEAERLGYAYEKPDGTYGSDFDTYGYKDFFTNPATSYIPGLGGLAGAGTVLKFFNSINPFNIGDELYRAPEGEKWSRAGELGFDAALDLATIISLGSSQALKLGVRGTQALNAYNKASKLKNVLSGLSKINPVNRMAASNIGAVKGLGQYGQRWGQNFMKYGTPVFAYESVRPGGYLPTAYTDFSEGNIGSGLANLGFGALNVSPYLKPTLSTIQGINQGIKSGNAMIINPASRYSFTIGNPITRKGFFYGNPNAIRQGEPLFPKTKRFVYDNYDNIFDVKRIPKQNFDKGGMVMELDENQIDEYAKNGYIIEDV